MNTDDTSTTLRMLLLQLARLGAPTSTKLPRVVVERSFIGDWIAYDDNTYDGPGSPIGYGATRREAIEDLVFCMEERALDDKREFLNGDQEADDLIGGDV